jgi:hypothetical protein
VGVNEQEAFEGGLEVRGESHHCVPHAHRIDGSNSQRAVAMQGLKEILKRQSPSLIRFCFLVCRFSQRMNDRNSEKSVP